jgi:hypothetical protein
MNFRFCGNAGNRKKGGWFPLQVGSHCSIYACPCEESESKYLLDPIDDYDVSLLAFDEEDYLRAKARCGTGNNPAAQQKLRSVCEQIREKTQSRAELSAVAKWCILFRNDSSLSRLIY